MLSTRQTTELAKRKALDPSICVISIGADGSLLLSDLTIIK